jgi:hypothetical protein
MPGTKKRTAVTVGVISGFAIIGMVVILVPAHLLLTQVRRPTSCDCDAEYGLVCGLDGHTYTGICEAECEAGGISRLGECRAL